MLSLPPLAPRPDASLWPSHRVSNNYFDAHNETSQANSSNAHNHRRPGSHHGQHGNSRSLLAALAADENAIDQRKQNVRRFGAGWIRPPGISKTLQASIDEQLEREEQEALARREQVMMDLAAAQQDAANADARAEGEEMEGLEEERDLDDEVPEAEADESVISASERSDSDAEEVDTSAVGAPEGDVTFNEDSFIEGSMVEAEVEHMLEMEEAEMAGVLQDERDLDDDIPEAGSYEHTDSELEDSSSEDDVSRPALSSGRRRSGRRSSGQRTPGLPQGQGNRSSFGIDGSSSILDGSSFLRSSPVAARGSLRDRFLGAGRGTGS